jgi:uncharacterized membrane protein
LEPDPSAFNSGAGSVAARRLARPQPQYEAYRKTMTGIFLGVLVIAGIFTFVPGRAMYRVLFGG